MNAQQSFTFHFSPFVTGNQASTSYLFLEFYDTATNSFVGGTGGFSSTTTSFTLPANFLLPGHNYMYELDFSNRDLVTAPGSQDGAGEFFDLRTDGLFSTSSAVPEPSSLLLLGSGAAGLIGVIRKRFVN